MSLEVTGKLVKVLAEQSGVSGGGKAWKKQGFVVETEEQYPKKVYIIAFGDKADILKSLNVGEMLKVFINIESREYNDKWYTDINLWKIEKLGGGEVSTNNYTAPDNFQLPPQEEGDLPF